MGGTVAYYTYTTYLTKYLSNTAGLEKYTATAGQLLRADRLQLPSSRWPARCPTGSAAARC